MEIIGFSCAKLCYSNSENVDQTLLKIAFSSKNYDYMLIIKKLVFEKMQNYILTAVWQVLEQL